MKQYKSPILVPIRAPIGEDLKDSQIPRLIDSGHYRVNTPLKYLHENLERYKDTYQLDLDPDFQRGHVWNLELKQKWVEYLLRGGIHRREILFNCPYFMGSAPGGRDPGPMVVVDGKQRLTATTEFLEGKINVFHNIRPEGYYVYEMDDVIGLRCDLVFEVNNLRTRREVLQWYLELNEGSIAHTPEELNRVRELLKQT